MTTQTTIGGLATRYQAASCLKPHPTNAKCQSEKPIGYIVKSISTYGWTNPILIDGELNVLAGHGRLEERRSLAWPRCRSSSSRL